MVQPKITMIGRTYGRLTVLEQAEPLKKDRQAWYRCRCACGGEITVRGTSLRNGSTASCGCLRREKTKKRNTEAAEKKFDLTGKRFAFLTAKERQGGAFWNCLCDCGTYCEVHAYKLKSGHTRSCGCSHREAILDLTGQEFGKLTVLGDSGRRRDGSGGMIWKCLCSCGQEKEIRQDALVSGAAASCGCVKSRGNEKVARLLREAGLSYQPEYSPPDMKGKRRFDFAVWEAGKLSYLIEYDGVLHFGYSDSGWDTEARYRKMCVSDREKNEYCFQKGIPLIRIPYTRFSGLAAEDLHPGTTAYLVTEKSRRAVTKEKSKGEKEVDEGSGEIFREDQIPSGNGDLTGSSGRLQKS